MQRIDVTGQVASQRGEKAQEKQDGNTEEASDAAPGGTEAEQASSGGGGGGGDRYGEAATAAAAGRRANKRKHDQVDGATPGRVGSRRTSLRAHVEAMIETVRAHLLAFLDEIMCLVLWLQLLLNDGSGTSNAGLVSAIRAVNDAAVRL